MCVFLLALLVMFLSFKSLILFHLLDCVVLSAYAIPLSVFGYMDNISILVLVKITYEYYS